MASDGNQLDRPWQSAQLSMTVSSVVQGCRFLSSQRHLGRRVSAVAVFPKYILHAPSSRRDDYLNLGHDRSVRVRPLNLQRLRLWFR